MRRNNKADMTITEQLQAVKDRVCEDVCKYREEALSTHDDPDDAEVWLMVECCVNCPMKEV